MTEDKKPIKVQPRSIRFDAADDEQIRLLAEKEIRTDTNMIQVLVKRGIAATMEADNG